MFKDLTITAQATDRLDALSEYFSSPHLQLEYIPYLGISVLVLIIMIWGSVLFMRWRARKYIYIPTGTINKTSNILSLLNYCVDKRTRMDFQLNMECAHPLFLSCIPVGINNNSLVLECSTTSAPLAPLNPGRELNFFFAPKIDSKPIHYRFMSKIITTTIPKKHFFHLNVEIPKEIFLGQKRNFLRIKPPEKLIMGLFIWPIMSNDKLSFEASTEAWGKPTLNYMSEDVSQFTLENISANGISLKIPHKYSHLQSLPFGKLRTFAMLLDFWSPRHQSPLKIWVICCIQRSAPDVDTRDIQIGAQFVSWGQSMPENPGFIDWNRLKQNEEIVLLADWIVQRNLDESRARAGTVASF